MAALWSTVRRRLADESGFTLTELLVAAVIGVLVAAGGAMVLQVAVKAQPRATERAGQIQQGRALMETLSRELREGQSISGATESGFEVRTFVNSAACGGAHSTAQILCSVTYSCAAGTCTRTEHDGAGGGTPTVVATDLLDTSIFTYCEEIAGTTNCDLPTAAAPTYIGIELAYPAEDGAETVSLADGVALRNYLAEAPSS